MPHLTEIQLFIRVAAAGGISEAARQLGLTPATASAAIKRLERELGSTLFERSTRSLRLTPAGEDFLGYCVASTELLDAGMAALRQRHEGISGEIQLGAPSDLGRGLLNDVLEAFRQQHPNVRIVMHLSDGLQDLYRNPLDLVLRYGVLRDSALIARKLCDNHRVICASPAYLARRGRPPAPAALTAHNCICFFRSGELYNRWPVIYDGHAQTIDVRGDRAADDGALVRQWVVAGHGIAYKSRLDIRDDLASGRLVDLFPDAQYEQVPLYAVYPSRAYVPARLKTLIQHLAEAFHTLQAA